VNNVPDSRQLDAFKNDVRTWIEVDNSIRDMHAAIRDRRAAKKSLTDRILSFMEEFNIEDLNTKDGRLRYRMSYVRAPLSHASIKDRISNYFASNASAAQEVHGAVFGNRERSEKLSLRRLKPT
jgi:hypothetical protein